MLIGKWFAWQQLSGIAKLVDPRVQRSVLTVLQALVDKRWVLGCHAFDELIDDARFADAWLAGDQYGLSLAMLGFAPATGQRLQFLTAPNKGSLCFDAFAFTFVPSRATCPKDTSPDSRQSVST